MDQIAVLPFLLQSFPENLVILSLGLTLTGVSLKWKTIITASLAAAIFSYIIRTSTAFFGLHSVAQLVFLVLILILLHRLSIIHSLLSVLIGSIALGLSEAILVSFLMYLSGISMQQLLADPWLRLLYSLPHIALLGFICWILRKKGWSLFSGQKIRLFKERKALNLLLLIALIQSFLLITVTMAFYSFSAGFFVQMDLSQLVVVATVSLFIAFVTTISVSWVMFITARKEARLEAELVHLNHLQELYITVKAQRHDFINHLVSLYGLHQTGATEEAREYLESLYADVKKSQTLINIGIPALSGLLQSKIVLAEEKGIKFKISTDPRFSEIPVKPVDLTAVLGNLLDNAFDAALELPGEGPTVRLELNCDTEYYEVVVTNRGKPISQKDRDKIFTAGYSTKNKDSHSGLGLYTVKSIVDKYHGQILLGEPGSFPGVKITVRISH
jgi:two-component system, LytTR family, sensor histidine kinase AgrC